MTREEAIKELLNMKRINYTLAPDECFDMAIMALERENTLLDRVLEIIDEADDENRNEVGVVQNDDMDKAYAIIYERISALKGGEKE